MNDFESINPLHVIKGYVEQLKESKYTDVRNQISSLDEEVQEIYLEKINNMISHPHFKDIRSKLQLLLAYFD